MATKKASRKHSSKKSMKMESFKVAKDVPPFRTFKFTKQTLYWTILMAVIVVFQLWILKLQMDIAAVTDALLAQ